MLRKRMWAAPTGVLIGAVAMALAASPAYAADSVLTYQPGTDGSSGTATLTVTDVEPGLPVFIEFNQGIGGPVATGPQAVVIFTCDPETSQWFYTDGAQSVAVDSVTVYTADEEPPQTLFLDEALCLPVPPSSSSAPSSAPSSEVPSSAPSTVSTDVVSSPPVSSSPAVTDSAASTVVSTSTSGSESVAPTTAASTSTAAAPAATTAATTSAAHAGPALAATGTAPESALYTALALLAGGAGLAYLGTKQRRRHSHS
ncbi:hypothetical protein H4P1_00020 (plasmid) [Variovorax sp. PBS-H4]|uniref:hypothetical protein n=1 Tax=Variovorax sp. PBS-H4 TaxID=434008 RepID=UPI00131600A5|nr:hypothetical protein [Variovorax sp. PBS-H4]VTU41388.1 hypothetical protein H4P1_00020 [Variovorax sp. PBS-H4]